jgi:rod shape-determining protein MreB
MNLTFHVAEDPLKAVARGTCIAIEDTDKYKFLAR